MALSKEKGKLIQRLRNPRFRPREAQFIAEGIRGCREVLDGPLGLRIRFGLISPRILRSPLGEELNALLMASGAPLVEVSDPELDALSDTERSQGVLLVVGEPDGAFERIKTSATPRVLLLDGIQDPGNAGTLIRAARAFGLSGVLALEGTVDPFNPKVVRASAGALAHIPVCPAPWRDVDAWLEEAEVPLLIADAAGRDVRSLDVSSRWALAVGNEGAGLRTELVGRSYGKVAVPMNDGVDSLNAGLAGAILLFSLYPPSGGRMED